MRWLSVKVIVSFDKVEIILYMAVTSCCFCRNVVTLLYFSLPSETEYQEN